MNTTLIFARCCRSSAAVTPVKYEWDVKNVTDTFARSKILLTEKLTNGILVTPTPGLWILAVESDDYLHEYQNGMHGISRWKCMSMNYILQCCLATMFVLWVCTSVNTKAWWLRLRQVDDIAKLKDASKLIRISMDERNITLISKSMLFYLRHTSIRIWYIFHNNLPDPYEVQKHYTTFSDSANFRLTQFKEGEKI